MVSIKSSQFTKTVLLVLLVAFFIFLLEVFYLSSIANNSNSREEMLRNQIIELQNQLKSQQEEELLTREKFSSRIAELTDSVNLLAKREGEPIEKKRKTKKAFVDGGANQGDSWDGFMQSNPKYPYKIHESVDRSEFEGHLFEGNPYFSEVLFHKKKEYPNQRLYIYMQPLWVADKMVSFYIDKVNQNNSYWGSSLDETRKDVINSGKVSVSVKAVDLARYLKEYFEPEDFVIVKLDVEGAEYDIIPHLIIQGALPLIDHLYVEWHHKSQAMVYTLDAPWKEIVRFSGIIFPDDYWTET